MLDKSEIARAIFSAHCDLNKVHNKFNHAYAEDRESLTEEDNRIWQSVVKAVDALAPVHDWAIDNM